MPWNQRVRPRVLAVVCGANARWKPAIQQAGSVGNLRYEGGNGDDSGPVVDKLPSK